MLINVFFLLRFVGLGKIESVKKYKGLGGLVLSLVA